MVKKYKSKMNTLRILANVGEEVIPVEFKWDLIYSNSGVRGCSFTTDDVELQKALESHEYFNRVMQPSFWTDDVEDVKPVKEKVDEPKKVKRYKETDKE